MSINFPIVTVAPTYVSWNTITGLPATLQVGTSIDTIILRDFLNAEPATTTWSVASGTLPSGLDFDYSTGEISGTPDTAGGAKSITVKVQETGVAENNSTSMSINFPIVTVAPTYVSWNTITGLPATLQVGTSIDTIPLRDFLNAEPATTTWSVASGTLPSGLDFDYSTGEISGTPDTAGGAKSITVKVQETGVAENNSTSMSINFPIVTVAPTYVSWNTITGLPATLQVGTSIDTIILRDFLNAEPATTTWSVASGTLPSGLDFDYSTGEISGTPDTAGGAKSITVKVQETGVAENNSTSMSINFPIVTVAGETLTFTTAPGTLTNVSAGTSINETISAVASQGSAVTYSFVSTNNKNMNGRGGTAIIITGNTISGIAPRLVVAATYSFVVTASANAGALVNTETFSIDIAGGAYCVSPVSNICL